MENRLLSIIAIIVMIGITAGVGYGIFLFVNKNIFADSSDLNNIESFLPAYSLPIYVGEKYANENAIRGGINWQYGKEENFTAQDVEIKEALKSHQNVKIKKGDKVKINFSEFGYSEKIYSVDLKIVNENGEKISSLFSLFELEENFLNLEIKEDVGTYYYEIKLTSNECGFVKYLFKAEITE